MGKLDQHEDGMRIVWMWFCRIFVVICILAELVVFIAEIIVMVNSIGRHAKLMRYGRAPADGYEKDGSSETCGYITNTNVPKHFGSIYFSSIFEVSILIWILLLVLADSVFLYKTEQNYANNALGNLQLKGLQEGSAQKERKLPPFFIAATAFLKLWIVACYETQSFVGLSDGKSVVGEEEGINVHRFCLIAGELAVSWSRHVVDKSRFIPTTIGFILLFSIVPGIAAQVFTYLGVDDDKYYEEN